MFNHTIGRSALLALTLTCCWTGPSQAAIYKSTDAHGNAVYSDSPSGNAQVVNLPPLSIIPSLSAEQMALATTPPGLPVASQAPDYQLAFVQPLSDQVVRKPEPFSVSVSVRPSLAAGDYLTIMLNGVVIAQGASALISSETLERGSHQLTARITNQAGRILGEAVSNVFIQQATLNSPQHQKRLRARP